MPVMLTAAAAFCAVAAAQQTQPAGTLPPAEARERNLTAYTELLRSDLRSQKVAVITQMMQFTDAEDKAFWPIYRAYELELSRVNDDRLALIEKYALVFDKLTPAAASDIAVRSLDLETRRTVLKQNYFNKLNSALSPITAVKALQIENQIQLLVDLQIAAALPVLK
jgi:hypothetical protein